MADPTNKTEERIPGAYDMAYPVLDTNQTPNGTVQTGLTKRELIAAMAMQGICGDGIPGSHHSPKETARDAVAYADALLKELAK